MKRSFQTQQEINTKAKYIVGNGGGGPCSSRQQIGKKRHGLESLFREINQIERGKVMVEARQDHR